MAAVFTLAITLSLTVYTFTTTSDPTVYGSMLFAALSILLVAGIFMMFTTSPLAQIIYCSFGALVYAGYIVYDTAV
jgi:FtsH-binding integral membrane protein